MATLYDLAHQYRRLADIEDSDFEVALTQLSDSADSKIINIAYLILEWTGEEATYKTERQRLQNHERSTGNRIDRLKEYLIIQMKLLEKLQVSGPTIKVSLQPSPPALHVNAEVLLPLHKVATLEMPLVLVPKDLEKYIKVTKPDNQSIRTLLEQKVKIDGATLERGQHIVIR